METIKKTDDVGRAGLRLSKPSSTFRTLQTTLERRVFSDTDHGVDITDVSV